MLKSENTEEFIRKALTREEKQREYNRRSYQRKKSKMGKEQQCVESRQELLPVIESRKDSAFISCTFCYQSINLSSIIRCVMCSEPRHPSAKCLRIPIDNEAIMTTFGCNGLTSYFCDRCSRHLSTVQDTVVSKTAMSNSIINATSSLEGQIRKMEEAYKNDRIEWEKEKRALIDENSKLLKYAEKKRKKQKKCATSADLARIQQINIDLLTEIRAFVTTQTCNTGSRICQQQHAS